MPYLQFLTGFTDFQIYPLSDFPVTQSLNCCACSYILLVGENSFTVKVRSWLKRKKMPKVWSHNYVPVFSEQALYILDTSRTSGLPKVFASFGMFTVVEFHYRDFCSTMN